MVSEKTDRVVVRVGRVVGRAFKRVVDALMVVGSSLGPARGAGDPEARKGYEQPNRDYRP